MERLEQIQNTLNGEPIEVAGVIKSEGNILLLFKTTTGSVYLPYDFVKQHFKDLLLEFILKHSKFKRFQRISRK